MAPLPTNLRRDLERAIIEARKAAESGARAALGSLTVGDVKVGSHLDAAGRNLRNRLRAHARQLGDARSTKGEQTINRLVRECAYEHWHRMLFARFLAENDLLIEPQSGVSVSLEDVQELAREQGVKPWPLAASFAQRMLPQIFRTDDPVLAIDLPTETVLRLESLLEGLSPDVFTADDSLGWTYQFWQSAQKDAVNDRVKSGEKITGETLPAVTQLFTEHYMVLFLLHNTIGAWHAGKVLTSRDREVADSEQALRDAVRLSPHSGYDFEYLRFVREGKDGEDLNAGTGPWRPAAGAYDGWPKTPAELRILDPCCGSGHFLVAAFDLLVHLRIAEENLTTEAAIRAVLSDNLFGLELDPRCTQIAAFNLAFAAWKLAGKPIDLPALNIACSGIGPQSTRDEWLKMAERALEKEPSIAREPIRRGLIYMHELFSDAPELGSLIDPSELPAEGFAADFETIKPLLDRILAAETADDEAHERAVAARGMAAAAHILADDYTLVITNVPYLGLRSMSPILQSFITDAYSDAKSDLATTFVSRMVRWVGDGRNGNPAGTCAAVTPQNWLFLSSYKRLRERLLKQRSWEFVARLGPGAFETIGGHVVNVALLAVSGTPARKKHVVSGLDVSGLAAAATKSDGLRGLHESGASRVQLATQSSQLANPDSRVVMSALATSSLLEEHAEAAQGVITGDLDKWQRCYWEVQPSDNHWRYFLTAPRETAPFAARSGVVDWSTGGEGMVRPRLGNRCVGRDGVAIAQVGGSASTLYLGELYDGNVAPVVPHNATALKLLWSFCSTGAYFEEIRKLDAKMNITNGTFLKVPFDPADSMDDAVQALPEPQSDDPTQWLFHGRPERADIHAILQVGVARLVGYRWPAELDEHMRLAPEARALVERCAELADFADEDGIVCLSPLRGEASAADRLRRLLAAAFGGAWSNAKERELLAAVASFHKDSTPASNLDTWLQESFFEQHCKLFHHRPFVWHIWDGRKDGFNALINYHCLAGPDGAGRRTLEALTYSYLGDWIQRQQDGVKSNEPGAEARLAAAMELKDELEKILAGEPPYDIFVRWKPLHEQPIGWEPDINDGVRLNIRPFMSATLSKGKKGAGVLRWKPNIKWEKDRGKEPQKLRPREMFPWFWGWDEKKAEHTIDFGSGLKDTAPAGREFDGNRWNDLHYTNAAKQAARERVSEEVS